MSRVPELASAARQAARPLAQLDGGERSSLLLALADALEDDKERAALFEANAADMRDAEAAEERGELASALVKRLALSSEKLASLADGLRTLADQPEYLNQRDLHRELDAGLVLERRSAPLGVLGIVFEARPDAVPQITGLALKSGNAVLLKGGSEALRSNRALVALIHRVMQEHGLAPASVALLEDRAEFGALLDEDEHVDLIIARGSTSFVKMVMDKTNIPVMGHAEGLCHLYLHADAAPDMAAKIAVDAKCSYPAACNSIETLLWHASALEATRASLAALAEARVELRGDAATRDAFPEISITAADDADWSTEYTDKILSVRQVGNVDEALAHIDEYGSAHTESIVTADASVAETFLASVDAAGVFWNASTRFADGYRYGHGAEVGISTGKLHARGPVGVEGLLTYRYLLRGDGQVSTDYGEGKRKYSHRILDPEG
jgi:glutamate-5-semialdehyde dehydrogenase